MNKCRNCGEETKSPAYCSRKCSELHKRETPPKRNKKTWLCKDCGKETGKRRIYCDECFGKHRPPQGPRTLASFAKYSGRDQYMHTAIRGLARKKVNILVEKGDVKRACFHCGYDKYVEVSHIKPVASFDYESTTIDEVNSLKNLSILCPNCHYEFDGGCLESVPSIFDEFRPTRNANNFPKKTDDTSQSESIAAAWLLPSPTLIL